MEFPELPIANYDEQLLWTTPVSYESVTNKSVPFNISEEVDSYYFYEKEQFAVLGILFFFIVLGNGFVLLALFIDKQRKSRMNFFIMQLALADLTVGLFNVLTDIIWHATVTWHAGNIACKLIRFLQAMVTYSSTYVLVALSIDRYDAITHPMNFSGGSRRARVLVILAWFFSAIFSMPLTILYEERYIQEQLQCWIELKEPWHWQMYMTLVSVALFVVPAIIILACYTVIVRTIWSKGKLLTGRPSVKGHDSDECDSRRASSRGLIPRAKIKTIKMTFVIVFVFIICWSPYIVFDLLQVYGYVPKTQTNIAVASFIQSLAPLNSAANPLICCCFSNHLRRNLRKVPPFRWCMPFNSSRRGHLRNDSTGTVTESLPSTRMTSFRQIHTKLASTKGRPVFGITAV